MTRLRDGGPAAAAWAAGASASVLVIGRLDPQWTAWVAVASLVACTGGLAAHATRHRAVPAVLTQIAATWVTLAIGVAVIAVVNAAVHNAAIGTLWDTPLLVAQLVLSVTLAVVQLLASAASRARPTQRQSVTNRPADRENTTAGGPTEGARPPSLNTSR